MIWRNHFFSFIAFALVVIACEHRAVPQAISAARPEDADFEVSPPPNPSVSDALLVSETSEDTPTLEEPSVTTPPICTWNISGHYRLTRDAQHLYHIDDDGVNAVITSTTDSVQTRIELVRTPGGFVGKLLKTVEFESGPTCQIEFDAEILACTEAMEIQLSLDDVMEIDARCDVIHRGEPREVLLLRNFMNSQ